MKPRVYALFCACLLLISCSPKNNSAGVPALMEAEKTVVTNDVVQNLRDAALLYAVSLHQTEDLPDVAAQNDAVVLENAFKDVLNAWRQLDIISQKILSQTEKQASLPVLLFPSALAYDAQEITDIIDAAPPGRQVRTLAEKLGVSAKKAYQILKMSQSELEAQAWNASADAIERLENQTKLVKDGCKVGLIVGGVVLSGGIGNMALFEQATLVINGADLVFEVGDDTANIALGYNNGVSALISDIRKITKPATAVFGLINLGGNTLDTFTFMGDQLNSTLQDGEVLGIDMKPAKPVAQPMARAQLPAWSESVGAVSEPDFAGVMQEAAAIVKTFPAPASEIEKLSSAAAGVNKEEKEPEADTKTAEPEKAPDIPAAAGSFPRSLNGTIWEQMDQTPEMEGSHSELRFSETQLIVHMYYLGKEFDAAPLPYKYKDGVGSYGGADPRGVREMPFTIDGDILTVDNAYAQQKHRFKQIR